MQITDVRLRKVNSENRMKAVGCYCESIWEVVGLQRI